MQLTPYPFLHCSIYLKLVPSSYSPFLQSLFLYIHRSSPSFHVLLPSSVILSSTVPSFTLPVFSPGRAWNVIWGFHCFERLATLLLREGNGPPGPQDYLNGGTLGAVGRYVFMMSIIVCQCYCWNCLFTSISHSKCSTHGKQFEKGTPSNASLVIMSWFSKYYLKNDISLLPWLWNSWIGTDISDVYAVHLFILVNNAWLPLYSSLLCA